VLNAPHEKSLGFRAHKQMIHTLVRLGVPFRVVFLDNLCEKDLAGTKLLVLPFAHSIGKKAVAALQSAKATGVKMLIFGPLGELSPEGAEHEKPLLSSLVDGLKQNQDDKWREGKEIIYFPDASIAAAGLLPSNRKLIDNAIAKLCGKELSIRVYQKETGSLEVSLRQRSPSDRTLIAVNWSPQTAMAEIELRGLPESNYIRQHWDVLEECAKPDETGLTTAQASKFKIELPPYGAEIIHVIREEK